MGRNVRTGIQCSFMPGVLIGENSRIGPKSFVEENIQNNSFFYTKFQKIIKKEKLRLAINKLICYNLRCWLF